MRKRTSRPGIWATVNVNGWTQLWRPSSWVGICLYKSNSHDWKVNVYIVIRTGSVYRTLLDTINLVKATHDVPRKTVADIVPIRWSVWANFAVDWKCKAFWCHHFNGNHYAHQFKKSGITGEQLEKTTKIKETNWFNSKSQERWDWLGN